MMIATLFAFRERREALFHPWRAMKSAMQFRVALEHCCKEEIGTYKSSWLALVHFYGFY